MLFGRAKKRTTKWIPVRPKNYRRIALYAIGVASSPVVLVNGRLITDFSEAGPLTQRKIRGYGDLIIFLGDSSILGFHDHPDEMWVTETHAAVADYCASQGWLNVQGPAS